MTPQTDLPTSPVNSDGITVFTTPELVYTDILHAECTMLGGPGDPLPPVFFFFKNFWREHSLRNFENSGGDLVRPRLRILSKISPRRFRDYDFAPPPQRRSEFADPCGRIFDPSHDGSANYRDVRT